MKSSFELNGGTCRQVGDYKIPNITLPAKESRIRLGKWGMLHKDYMLHHKEVQFTIMLQTYIFRRVCKFSICQRRWHRIDSQLQRRNKNHPF